MTWDTCKVPREIGPEPSAEGWVRGTQVRGPHLALLLAGLLGWPQALDLEAVAVLLVAPEPLVQLGCPLALALLGAPVGLRENKRTVLKRMTGAPCGAPLGFIPRGLGGTEEFSHSPDSCLGELPRVQPPPPWPGHRLTRTCPAGCTSRTTGPGPAGSCGSHRTGGRLPRGPGQPGRKGRSCRDLETWPRPSPWAQGGPHLLGSQDVEVAATAVHQQVGADGCTRGPHLLGVVHLALGAVDKNLDRAQGQGWAILSLPLTGSLGHLGRDTPSSHWASGSYNRATPGLRELGGGGAGRSPSPTFIAQRRQGHHRRCPGSHPKLPRREPEQEKTLVRC